VTVFMFRQFFFQIAWLF